MRYLFRITFVLTCSFVWSQDIPERIKKVEQGLTFQTIVPLGDEIPKGGFTQKLQEYNIPGASVAVISNGKLEWSKSYGVAEVGKTTPITNKTLFQCASIGKMITAIAALQLVEGGKLDLDENVNDKLSTWRVQENENTAIQKVTLRHLLSHSAGLTDDYGFLGYEPGNEIPTLLQILNRQHPAKTKKKLTIETIPGKKERYSGGGYLIVQLLIEETSGLQFNEYVEQNILDPLGMSNTTYDNEPDKNSELPLATGHYSNGKALKKKKYHIYPEKAAAGPWTTAEDLAKFILGIQMGIHGTSPLKLNQQILLEFLSPQINNKGLGNNLKGVDKPMAFWHAGQNLGYTGLVYGLVEGGKGAAILLNSDRGEKMMQEFVTSVAMEYDWPVMKSFKTLEVPQKLKSSLTGNYTDRKKSQNLDIQENKGKLLVITQQSKNGIELFRIGENQYTFQNAQDYYKIVFDFENNQVVGLTYSQSIGKTVVLKKTETQ